MQGLKSLLVTALILAGAFLAYDRYLAPDEDKLVFKPELPGNPAPMNPVPTPTPDASLPPTVAATPTSPTVEPPKPEPMVAAAPTPSAPAPVPTPVTDGFVPPNLPTVDDATQNWTRIPPTAFPRKVNLLQDTTFRAGFGSTQVKAGATVTVLAVQQGALTLAPNETSTLRASVPWEVTDLKAVLTQVYDAWKVRRLSEARRAWEQRDVKAVAVSVAPAQDASGRPQRDTSGGYPLLLASMKAGTVTEITPQSITKWGDPEKGEVNGKPGWIVPVEFDAMTAFGKFSTEAIAKVLDGRVVGWYYKGSGEVVP